MKRNNALIILIATCILIITMTLFYLLTFNNIFTLPMRWISLLFLVLVEVVGLVVILNTRRNIIGTAIITLAILHLVIVFVISLLYVNVLPFDIIRYVIINTLIFAIVIILYILLANFSMKSQLSNVNYKVGNTMLSEIFTSIKDLSLTYSNTEYKKDLEELIEFIAYKRVVNLTGYENNILERVNELKASLKNSDESKIKEDIKKIRNLFEIISNNGKKIGDF
jgi:hypothetical protein